MKKEFKIGIAGIAALAILIVGINFLKGINLFSSTDYYVVEFTDVSGLSKSSPVFANGYQIGTVSDVKFNRNKPGYVSVGIDVEKGIDIPSGTTAELVTEMLGTVKMNLHFDYTQNKFLTSKDTIYGTVNAGILGAAEKNLLPQIERMMPKLDSILSSVNTLLQNPALNQTLQNTEALTASLRQTSQQLNAVMTTQLPNMTNNMTEITENFKVVSENLKQVNYAQSFRTLDSTLQNVEYLSSQLTRKDNTLGLLMTDSTLYWNMSATMGNAANLLQDLQAHPKRYVHFSLFGRKDKTKEKAAEK